MEEPPVQALTPSASPTRLVPSTLWECYARLYTSSFQELGDSSEEPSLHCLGEASD